MKIEIRCVDNVVVTGEDDLSSSLQGLMEIISEKEVLKFGDVIVFKKHIITIMEIK